MSKILFTHVPKKFINFLYCFFSRVQFLIVSKKFPKFLMIFVFFSVFFSHVQKMTKIFSKFYIDTSILPTFFHNIFIF